jgi:hypothetical protein
MSSCVVLRDIQCNTLTSNVCGAERLEVELQKRSAKEVPTPSVADMARTTKVIAQRTRTALATLDLAGQVFRLGRALGEKSGRALRETRGGASHEKGGGALREESGEKRIRIRPSTGQQ